VLVISLRSLLEEAASTGKYDIGNIEALRNLLDPGNLAKLNEFAEAVCFLAFHPRGDSAVTDYVRGGTLADDSGPGILVLFTLDEQAPIAIPVSGTSLGVSTELGIGVHPAYQLVRALFDGKPAPALPGLVVFGNLATDTDGVYVPLSHLDTEREVRTHLREVFSDIGFQARAAKPAKFLDDLGVRLSSRGLKYQRTNRRPMREWLLEGFRLTKQNYGDIVGTIGLFR
jgi:hypothetical protein